LENVLYVRRTMDEVIKIFHQFLVILVGIGHAGDGLLRR
jgi:hypothetical protein